jgi:hypothetical protein
MGTRQRRSIETSRKSVASISGLHGVESSRSGFGTQHTPWPFEVSASSSRAKRGNYQCQWFLIKISKKILINKFDNIAKKSNQKNLKFLKILNF